MYNACQAVKLAAGFPLPFRCWSKELCASLSLPHPLHICHMKRSSCLIVILFSGHASCDAGQDCLLLLYISLLGSAASYGVFFFNASRGNLTALSSLTFLTPLFAAITGFFVLGEVLSPVELTGAGITLGAVYLLNAKSTSGKEEA